MGSYYIQYMRNPVCNIILSFFSQEFHWFLQFHNIYTIITGKNVHIYKYINQLFVAYFSSSCCFTGIMAFCAMDRQRIPRSA